MYLAKIRNNEVVRVSLEEAATGEGWTPIPEELIAEAGDIGACVRRLVVTSTGTLALEDEPQHDEPQAPMPEEPPEPTAPTHEEVEQARAAAYRATVDPITCEIARLRDMGGSTEEIAEAEARREAAVKQIKEQYPYPEVTNV